MPKYTVGDEVEYETVTLFKERSVEKDIFRGTIVEKKKHGHYGIARFGNSQFPDWVKEEDILCRVKIPRNASLTN